MQTNLKNSILLVIKSKITNKYILKINFKKLNL